MSKAMQK